MELKALITDEPPSDWTTARKRRARLHFPERDWPLGVARVPAPSGGAVDAARVVPVTSSSTRCHKSPTRHLPVTIGPRASRMAAGCATLHGSQFRDLLDAKHNVLFDCDGVIWNGETAVTGAPEVVSLLKQRGKRVFFVTNNCTRPRESYVQKFGRLGFTGVAEEEIFSSAYCSAAYLRDVARVRGKVYVIGCGGVVRELRDAGVHVLEEVGDDEPGTNISNCPLDPDVKAVLVGYDENFTFMKLAKACCYLRNSECLFLATDPDPWHPLRGGRITPGSGSLTAALETASSRKATVIGKPGRFMFECIASQFDLDPARSLMVGDRLETDILFGSNCGLSTMLTLTGVSTMEEAQKYKDSESPERKGCIPDYVVESIADFLEALEE